MLSRHKLSHMSYRSVLKRLCTGARDALKAAESLKTGDRFISAVIRAEDYLAHLRAFKAFVYLANGTLDSISEYEKRLSLLKARQEVADALWLD